MFQSFQLLPASRVRQSRLRDREWRLLLSDLCVTQLQLVEWIERLRRDRCGAVHLRQRRRHLVTADLRVASVLAVLLVQLPVLQRQRQPLIHRLRLLVAGQRRRVEETICVIITEWEKEERMRDVIGLCFLLSHTR